jgi:hypothetical protein
MLGKHMMSAFQIGTPEPSLKSPNINPPSIHLESHGRHQGEASEKANKPFVIAVRSY